MKFHALIRICLLATLPVLLVATLFGPALAAEEHHALVRFWIDNPADEAYIAQNHMLLDIVAREAGQYVDIVVRHSDLEQLRAGAVASRS